VETKAADRKQYIHIPIVAIGRKMPKCQNETLKRRD
jgi:hypothetical protein